MLILGFISVGVFTVSHLIGVNIRDPHLSRNVLMFNLANIFLSCFFAHCTFAVTGKLKEEKMPLMIIYTVSAALFIFYLIFPDFFLLDSRSKLYFLNYYVPGPYHWIMRVFSNMLVPLYFFIHIIRVYPTSVRGLQNRLKYFFVSFLLGYAFGSVAILLVYNIPVDPAWASYFGVLFAVPFAYAVVKFDLMDIRVVAKKALVYALLVILMGFLTSLVSLANNYILTRVPEFPLWFFPFLISLVTVTIGIFVWRKIKEVDILKYEFINVATHKFRTPLTHIKWASENALQRNVGEETKKDLIDIQHSTTRLTELTNLLVGVSETESKNYLYKFEVVDFSSFLTEVLADYAKKIEDKKITLEKDMRAHLTAKIDATRIKFVLQILLDNAVNYTPAGGKVSVRLWQDQDKTICEIKDTGVGMAREDLGRVFERFYRGDDQKKLDTEGLGVGLYLARQIISHHEGSLQVSSEGKGKGSTFSFSVPVR